MVGDHHAALLWPKTPFLWVSIGAAHWIRWVFFWNPKQIEKMKIVPRLLFFYLLYSWMVYVKLCVHNVSYLVPSQKLLPVQNLGTRWIKNGMAIVYGKSTPPLFFRLQKKLLQPKAPALRLIASMGWDNVENCQKICNYQEMYPWISLSIQVLKFLKCSLSDTWNLNTKTWFSYISGVVKYLVPIEKLRLRFSYGGVGA